MNDHASPGAGGDPFAEDPSLQAAETPLWREVFFGLDWFQLRMSPVFLGCGIPRGHGEPVVVVPGFMGDDLYLVELFNWLARVGYQPYFSDIGRNADCPDYLQGKLIETVKRARRDTGKKPILVGHSLGGMLSRSLALDNPDMVGGVISMGSPFRDSVRAHPIILHAAAALRRNRRHGGVGANIKTACFSGHCTCAFVKNMLAPEDYRVPHFAIFSRNDGVVEWQSCIEDDPDLNDEVSATHIGMAFHPGVYKALGRRLGEIAAA